MRDPFQIQDPAVISFSGGRTSAYMLHQIAQATDLSTGDVRVMFANTGKEREETLVFVRECARRWDIQIEWLEYSRRYLPQYKSTLTADRCTAIQEHAARAYGRIYEPANGRKEPGYRIVTFETASRNGEPFDNMIDLNGLPNRSLRMCTAEMKIRVIKKRMIDHGFDYWDCVLGLRADEPERVARKRVTTRERWEHVMPLADAKITEDDVMAFWSRQPFDLGLEQHEGNCDLCFLKTPAKKQQIATRDPSVVDWWAASEERTGSKFRPNEPLLRSLVRLPVLQDAGTSSLDCFCTN